MAAPFFTNPDALRTDLVTLGYPDVNEKSVLSQGGARLALLTWLAQQVDPTFVPSTPENLAAFWDRLGVHSTAPNKAGHRIPFTAPGDRTRDKNAASCFLRTAIDLVFAFRARRAEDPLSSTWTDKMEEIHEEDTPLSKFDSESLEQIGELINQRHLLFPNTTKLFESNPAKKRPLQRRQVDINRKPNHVPRSKKMGKAEKDSIPSRENVLDRLRQVQRRAHDLEVQLADKRCERKKSMSSHEGDGIEELDNDTIRKLANDADALCDLVERFDCITRDGLAERDGRTDLAKRDLQMEANLSELCRQCNTFHKDTQQTFDSTRRAKMAVEELVRSRPLLEGLTHSAAVQEVLRHQQRTKQHM